MVTVQKAGKPTVRQVYALAAASASGWERSSRSREGPPPSSSSGCVSRTATPRRGSRTRPALLIVSLHVATGAAAGALRVRGSPGPSSARAGTRPARDPAPGHFVAALRGRERSRVRARGRSATRPDEPERSAPSQPRRPTLNTSSRDSATRPFPSHRIPGWHREGGIPAWAHSSPRERFCAGPQTG